MHETYAHIPLLFREDFFNKHDLLASNTETELELKIRSFNKAGGHPSKY